MTEEPRRSRRLIGVSVIAVVAVALLAAAATYIFRGDDNPALTWTAVSTDGLPPNFTYPSSIACPSDDECWLASQNFGLAHLTNRKLTAVGLDIGPSSVACRAVDDCWAGSQAEFLAGAYHFDGTEWQLRPPPLDGSADANALIAGSYRCTSETCVASGGAFVSRYALVWDGAHWQQSEPIGDQREVRALSCIAVDDCYGFAVSADGQPKVLRLNGGQWTITEETSRRTYGLGGLRTESECPTPDNCVVLMSNWGGPWAEVSQLQDGQWVSTDPTNRGLPSQLWAYDLACTSTSNCFIVGARKPLADGGDDEGPAVWQWNGQQWQEAPTATAREGILSSVSCATPSSCWAVGYKDGGQPILLHGVPS